MTFYVTKNEDGKRVNVHTTYGPISIQVAEEVGHARQFCNQLDRLLAEFEPKPQEVDS